MTLDSRNLACVSEDPPLVVKFGGSLSKGIPDLAPVLAAAGRPLLIVPGGGLFADMVRGCGAAGEYGHWMAIAAMDQYGWFIAAHGIPATPLLEVPVRPLVFLPYCTLRNKDPLPHTWEITSDTIAAWIADYLGLELLVLKSVDGIILQESLVEQLGKPIDTDVVDPFFLPFVLEKKIRTTIINGSHPQRVRKFLDGERVCCTRISTTF